MMDIPFKGNIKEFSIPRILLYLNRNRKTGTLIITTSTFTKKVYMDKGDAIFASSTFEDDRLGEMLVKAGKITIQQLEESVELLKSKKKRQGAILVELGYLTPKDLFWGVKYQVKEIIHSLFALHDAKYEFIEGDLPKNEVITLKMSMGNLIYEGVKNINNLNLIMKEMDINSTLKLSADPESLFQDIELDDRDKKLLFRIDGRKTVKELADSSPNGSFEALKTLYALWATGTLEEKEEIQEQAEVPLEEILNPVSDEEEAFIKRVDEVYSNLGNLTSEELLEVDKNSDAETINRNYYRLIKEFHPDRYFASANLSVKDKLIATFDAIKKAYALLKEGTLIPQDSDTLKTVDRKDSEVEEEVVVEKEEVIAEKEELVAEEKVQETKEVDLTKEAEDYFRLGVDEFKKGNYIKAIEFFKLSTGLNPHKAKYWSHLSLSFTKVPNGLDDAEEALLQSIKLEPDNAEHYANLGQIYLKAGMKKEANNQFEKALEINPENIKAQKGLTLTKT
jgi:tetratricopeptide (TPR) repeat protein